MKRPKPVNRAKEALLFIRRLHRDATQPHDSDKAANALEELQALSVQLFHEGMLTYLLDAFDDEQLAEIKIARLP